MLVSTLWRNLDELSCGRSGRGTRALYTLHPLHPPSDTYVQGTYVGVRANATLTRSQRGTRACARVDTTPCCVSLRHIKMPINASRAECGPESPSLPRQEASQQKSYGLARYFQPAVGTADAVSPRLAPLTRPDKNPERRGSTSPVLHGNVRSLIH